MKIKNEKFVYKFFQFTRCPITTILYNPVLIKMNLGQLKINFDLRIFKVSQRI